MGEFITDGQIHQLINNAGKILEGKPSLSEEDINDLVAGGLTLLAALVINSNRIAASLEALAVNSQALAVNSEALAVNSNGK